VSEEGSPTGKYEIYSRPHKNLIFTLKLLRVNIRFFRTVWI
jgi:hypothetical protein